MEKVASKPQRADGRSTTNPETEQNQRKEKIIKSTIHRPVTPTSQQSICSPKTKPPLRPPNYGSSFVRFIKVLLPKQAMDISHVTDHSSSMSRQPPDEVFLSFRGPDIRRGFADYLYTMLRDTGIRVFRDEEELEKGKENYQQLIQVIEQCMISIPIISKEYASSKNCLAELKQMVEGMDNKNCIIIPIFYYVDPSNVRKCNGPFTRSLVEHRERGVSDSVIDSWKSALRRICELKGYHLHTKNEVSHGEFVKQIVHQVQQKLNKEHLIVPQQLVGVDPHVKAIMEKLDVEYRNGQAVKIGDTRKKVLGICGIAGVGKTVLAKFVYSRLGHLYADRSFCGKIQAEIEHGDVPSVQNKLISDLSDGNAQKFNSSDKALIFIRSRFKRMKILLLLDDVKDHEQLGKLVGKLDWLGQGSRVIVTSQRKDVLKNIDGGETFDLGPMEEDEALTFFCRHAFRADSPGEKFTNLSRKIVAATGRLPLALQVVGSYLYLEHSKKAWRETLAELKVAPDEKVQTALAKSYTNLNDKERQIFLDIACFFIGEDNRIPYYMWADCNYSPPKSIPALKAGSLVEIGEDNQLSMHQTLKNFGREMVRSESRKEPSNRSRLCDHEEALHVLKRRKGTRKVEALGLKFGDGSEGHTSFTCDQFDGLQNLRFLKLDRADIQGNFGDRLSSLRWLDWQGCPKNINVQRLNLNLPNLVVLNLSGSQVERDWGGWELLKQARKLKVLKLTGCVQLIATPEFPASMELERLILEGCSNLSFIHPSFGNLKKLVSLNMKGCRSLHKLPDLGPMRGLTELVIDGTAITRINFQGGSMRKLQILSARDCKGLTEISDSITHLKSLTYLALDGSDIITLPEPIGSLERLKTLSLKNCQSLTGLPNGIGKLRSLQVLDLSNDAIEKLPTSVKDLKAMKTLRMRRTFIRDFPQAILNLEKLEEIDFSSCRNLEGTIPDEIGGLKSLAVLNLSDTQIYGLPECLSLLPRLQKLDISSCDKLESLPELPSSVIVVR